MHCFDMYLYTFKIMHYFGMGHIPKQMFVRLTGFQICMCPGFLLQKFMINYHSSEEFVVNQSLHYCFSELGF